jgi:hypothetical protein
MRRSLLHSGSAGELSYCTAELTFSTSRLELASPQSIGACMYRCLTTSAPHRPMRGMLKRGCCAASAAGVYDTS